MEYGRFQTTISEWKPGERRLKEKPRKRWIVLMGDMTYSEADKQYQKGSNFVYDVENPFNCCIYLLG